MITEEDLRRALVRMNYHKVNSFIKRCKIEVDGGNEFTEAVIKDVAFSMLDRDLEKRLYFMLGMSI